MSEKQTWWAIGRYRTNIIPKEFVRATDHMLIDTVGNKCKRVTDWDVWFPSREEAVVGLRKFLEEKVKETGDAHAKAVANLAAFNNREGGGA